MMDFEALKAEFPQSQVHWRAQTVTKAGDKAMALAYVDARDVMNRLDEVVGPENWQDDYTTAGGRTICKLAIRVGDEWVSKSDGAGDTAVEGEKGGISDAFKRAAVKWGVARYLYDLPCPWVPCESYEANGKKHFRKFTDDPWKHVRSKPSAAPKQGPPAEFKAHEFSDPTTAANTSGDSALIREVFRMCVQQASKSDTLKYWWENHQYAYQLMTENDQRLVNDAFNKRKRQLDQKEAA